MPTKTTIYSTNVKFLGRYVVTDYLPLTEILNSEPTPEALDAAFPGFWSAVINSLLILDKNRAPANTITYFNFRVQAWALGFDADGTPPIRVIPSGVSTDPSGPITFDMLTD